MRTIHHVVDIDASAEKVWEAPVTQDGLGRWWSSEVAMDPADVGTVIRFTFAGDFNPLMEITDLEATLSLGWRCVGGHSNWSDNTFRFEPAALDDGRTRLRFTQNYAVELSDDDYGIYNFNWGYYLESLRLVCTQGVGRPFQPSKA